jgi:Ase1/PRC1/MAP65 family protein
MFKGVDQWNELFGKYRVMDAEDKDPNRFKNNRGGALLKKQKEFKKCKVQLTQLENNLKADIAEWQKDNEKEFQVDGVGFIKYIETQWGDVCESKDMERIVRNQKKKVELAREMVRVV